jgi:uncharacterized protein YecT (DUF1311 family)
MRHSVDRTLYHANAVEPTLTPLLIARSRTPLSSSRRFPICFETYFPTYRAIASLLLFTGRISVRPSPYFSDFSRQKRHSSRSRFPLTAELAALTHAARAAVYCLAHASQEPLRKAERAWIDFSNKNEALFDSLLRENLLSDPQHDAGELMEVDTRTVHLRVFFHNSGVPYNNPQEVLQAQEQRLTNAYEKCMAQLSGTDRELHRDAERAWVVYRDLNTWPRRCRR